MRVERQECHEEVWRNDWEPEPCNKPAKFTVDYLFRTWRSRPPLSEQIRCHANAPVYWRQRT